MIPKKPGERVKTDRRDGLKLASLFRSGELTPVWVPDEEQEAIRDLTRARGEMKRVELQLKQRVSAFLLRYSKRYTVGKSKWTQRYYRWLAEVKMKFPVQQIVLEEYVGAVKQAEERVRGLDKEFERVLSNWSLKPVVESLMALRGVHLLSAMSLVTELGGRVRVSEFDGPETLCHEPGMFRTQLSGNSWRQAPDSGGESPRHVRWTPFTGPKRGTAKVEPARLKTPS